MLTLQTPSISSPPITPVPALRPLPNIRRGSLTIIPHIHLYRLPYRTPPPQRSRVITGGIQRQDFRVWALLLIIT